MKLYADSAGRATNQVLGDALVLGWLLLWIWAGKQLHDVIMRLAVPGEKAESAARSLQNSLTDAGANIADVPLAGDDLRKPFDKAAASGREFAQAAQAYQDTVGDVALLAGVLVALGPIVIVLALWWPRRLRWISAASAATRLLGSDPGARDLLALRALAGRPLHELAASAPDTADLMQAWRSKDAQVVDQLARLELQELGLSPRRASDRGALT